MSVTQNILRTYTAPRKVMQGILAAGQREDCAIAILAAAVILIFVAQLPRLSREAFVSGQPVDMLIGGALMGWVCIFPIFAYGLAALSHIVARVFGGKGSWYGARIALFWTLLATGPLWLLNGLVAGFLGDGLPLKITGGLLLLAFFGYWALSLSVAERSPLGA